MLERFLGREHAAGERHLVGEAAPRPEPRGDPVLRAAEPALHLADLELRALGGDHEVAGLGERVAEAQRIAVDGGDHRLPVDSVAETVLPRAAPRRPAEAAHLLGRAELALLHVGPRAERAARAG